MSNYFVMINHPDQNIILPLMNDDNVMLFETEGDAHNIASSNGLADAYGFKVYQRP